MFSSSLKWSIVLVAFLVLGTSAAPAHLWKRCRATVPSEPGPMGNPYVHGGIVPRYGYDPRVVPNPYPWHAPAINSGFRHYHLVPPLDAAIPHGLLPPVGSPETMPAPGHEELPEPRKSTDAPGK